MNIELRDYFAAKAMQGLITNNVCLDTCYKLGKDGVTPEVGLAIMAYSFADAMLKIRKEDISFDTKKKA